MSMERLSEQAFSREAKLAAEKWVRLVATSSSSLASSVTAKSSSSSSTAAAAPKDTIAGKDAGEWAKRSLRRIEVLPSVRPSVYPGWESAEHTLGTYIHYCERTRSRLFAYDTTLERDVAKVAKDDPTFFVVACTERCHSAFNPGKVDVNAYAAYIIDSALGYHAIHVNQHMVLTRSLHIDLVDPDLDVGSTVVVVSRRTPDAAAGDQPQDAKGKGRKRYSCSCEGYDARTNRLIFRATGVFAFFELTFIAWAGDTYTDAMLSYVRGCEKRESEIDKMLAFNGDKPAIFLESVGRTFPPFPEDPIAVLDKNQTWQEVDWLANKPKPKHGMRYDFDPTELTATTILRVFRNTAGDAFAGLACFTNQTRGPGSAHGGSVLSAMSQLIFIATEGTEWSVKGIEIVYYLPTPILEVHLIDGYRLTPLGNGKAKVDITLRPLTDTKKRLAVVQATLEGRTKSSL